MRVVLLSLLLASPLFAASGALQKWRSDLRRLEREEARYWHEFQNRLNDALMAWRDPIEKADAQPHKFPEATYDYAPFERLYGEYARLQDAMGVADVVLASSREPRAAEALLEITLRLAKRIDELDEELADARPKFRRYLFEQRVPIERHGLEARRARLMEAFPKADGAAAMLAGEGWKRAERADKRRKATARVLVLDALAAVGGDEAVATLRSGLESRASAIRVAAVEGLVALGEPARAALAAHVAEEEHPVVRRAWLRALLGRETTDPRWLPAVAGALGRARGVEAARCVALLERASGQRFGHDAARWRTWLAEYADEIETGSFDRETVEVRDAEPAPPPHGISFFGVRAPTRHAIFVFEASLRLATPADVDVLKTQVRWLWRGTRSQWEDESPSHQQVLRAQLGETLRAYPEGGRFNLVALHRRFDPEPLEENRPVAADRRHLEEALRFVEKLPASGWCSQLEGLRFSAELAGYEPWKDLDQEETPFDTFYLLDSGDPAGGRYLTPASAVAAFERWNRFRRITVHALRIGNEGATGEQLMQGLAGASGGTYVWIREAP